MTYNFSEELKRNISMEHRRHSGVSHTGVAETLVEFERQYADIHASLESLYRAETHVQSLESIVVSLEAIKESTRGEKSVALAMANISLEAVEHSFELPTRTVAVSLEDGEPEEQTTTMVNKIKGALAAIKDSAVQVLGQIGQNLQALLGSVIAGATKFKSKLAGLKSQAGNAQGGQELSLGGTANMLTVGGGEVNGGSYVKDLSETMKIVSSGLSTFKTVDDFKAFGELANNAVQSDGKTDLSVFVKKLQAVNNLVGKRGLGGAEFSVDAVSEQEIEEYLTLCLKEYEAARNKASVKEGTNEPSMESIIAVSMENDNGAQVKKRSRFKRFLGILFFISGGVSILSLVGVPFGIVKILIGYRLYHGKWGNLNDFKELLLGSKASTESFNITMESLSSDFDIKGLAALSSKIFLNDGEEATVSSVSSLDGKQVSQVTDMLSSLADSVIAYAKSLKDRKAVTADIAKGLKEVQKAASNKENKEIVNIVNSAINGKIDNIVAFETSVNKYALNVLRAGVAYVEASVNTKAVETPAEEA